MIWRMVYGIVWYTVLYGMMYNMVWCMVVYGLAYDMVLYGIYTQTCTT